MARPTRFTDALLKHIVTEYRNRYGEWPAVNSVRVACGVGYQRVLNALDHAKSSYVGPAERNPYFAALAAYMKMTPTEARKLVDDAILTSVSRANMDELRANYAAMLVRRNDPDAEEKIRASIDTKRTRKKDLIDRVNSGIMRQFVDNITGKSDKSRARMDAEENGIDIDRTIESIRTEEMKRPHNRA